MISQRILHSHTWSNAVIKAIQLNCHVGLLVLHGQCSIFIVQGGDWACMCLTISFDCNKGKPKFKAKNLEYKFME